MNTINARLRLQQAIKAGKEREDYYNQLKSNVFGGNQNQQAPQYNQGEGIGFNEGGQYKIPAQQTINPFGVDTSGWGNPSGNSINVGSFGGETPKQNAWTNAFNKSFNEPPTDNPQAQAVEGQVTSPNYMSLMSNGQTNVQMTPQQQQAFDEKMNLRRWIEWDAQNNGVTNPLVSLQRYQMFMEPMRQQAELDELRNAYYTFNDPEASDVDKRNAATLIEYSKKNPYMTEDHDMNTERFNWARQNFENAQKMFPLQFESAQLGLEGKKLGLERNRNSVKIGDILRGFTGQVFPINRPGNYEDSDLSKTRKDLVDAADILNTYVRNKYGKDLTVTGGWRNPDHNAGVNGSPSSHHLTGHAMDIDASKLTEAELADVQNFARSIGLNADGDDMYHDRGSGYHMHITLPEGYYLKPIDLGNGKYLTPEMMRGVNGNTSDPFNAQDFSNAAYLWGGGADGKSKPNAELAKVLATKFVKDYRDALKKNGGNPQRAINAVQEIIKKDKQIVGPIEGNPMFDKLIFSIANEAALIANGQGGQAVQMPTEQNQTTKTDKPTNLGGWGAKVGNDNPSDRSKRDKSLDAIDNTELDENRIGMYNLDGYGQVPDAQDLNKQAGTRSYYESLLKYFGSGT